MSNGTERTPQEQGTAISDTFGGENDNLASP